MVERQQLFLSCHDVRPKVLTGSENDVIVSSISAAMLLSASPASLTACGSSTLQAIALIHRQTRFSTLGLACSINPTRFGSTPWLVASSR